MIAAARMNKRTARQLMRRIRREAPHVKIERFRHEIPSFSYCFDVVDPPTGKTATIREPGDWEPSA